MLYGLWSRERKWSGRHVIYSMEGVVFLLALVLTAICTAGEMSHLRETKQAHRKSKEALKRWPGDDKKKHAPIDYVRSEKGRIPIRLETLWLARCIYSESNRPAEQELVAWVVRNRVETGFRGAGSYQEAILDPGQFSAFNRQAPYRRYYASLLPGHKVAGWKKALLIAKRVRFSPEAERPFPKEVRHFYSEVSMPVGRPPDWAVGRRPIIPMRPYQIDPRRFRFFAGVPPSE